MKKPHENLDGWKPSMNLVREVHRVTNEVFPKGKRFSLTDQVGRAAISIPSHSIAKICPDAPLTSNARPLTICSQ